MPTSLCPYSLILCAQQLKQPLLILYLFTNTDVQHIWNIQGPGGSMSYVVGLPDNSYKPITNTAWVRARLCKLQKGCTRLAAASDKVYQLLAYGRWFSPSTPFLPPLKLVVMM